MQEKWLQNKENMISLEEHSSFLPQKNILMVSLAYLFHVMQNRSKSCCNKLGKMENCIRVLEFSFQILQCRIQMYTFYIHNKRNKDPFSLNFAKLTLFSCFHKQMSWISMGIIIRDGKISPLKIERTCSAFCTM